MKKTILIAGLACSIFTMTNAVAQTVEKQHWINSMRTAVPTLFCAPQQYFRQCFNVSAATCEQTAARATRVCISDLEQHIPATLNQPDDGFYWGSKLGECAGNTYELTLMNDRISSDLCNNVENWQ